MHQRIPLTARAGVIVALAVGAGACSGGVAGDLTGDEARPEATAEPAVVETLDFEAVAAVIDEEWPVEVTIPLGWHLENDVLGRVEVKIRDHNDEGWLSPEPGDVTSVFTSMQFDTGCDGSCEPNDWQARLNGPGGWLRERREQKELVRDEALAGGWVQVEPERRDLEVVVVLWDDAAPRFLECEVEVDDDDVDRVDEFVDACAAARPGWFVG